MVFEVGIGTSQNWDPVTAGREVIEQALSKLSQPPKFVLLFSTIHYEKNKGFQKILETIYEQIPKETPLVGGTVAGFMNNTGVYTRGLTAMACYSDEIEVATGVGHSTKRNPKKAAREFVNNIKKMKINEKFKNKLLIDFISGPTMPHIPFIKRINLVRSKIIGELMAVYGLRASSLFGFGVGKEEEIIRELQKSNKTSIFGGSATDAGKLISNYQFNNKTVLKNSITGLLIYTNNQIFVDGFSEMTKTNVCFRVDKKSTEDRVIKTINDKPATIELLNKLGFTNEVFNNLEQLYRTTFYFPISISDDDSSTTTIGAIYGTNLAVGHKLQTNNIKLLSASGKQIVNSPNTFRKILENKNKLTLIIACETGMEALGGKIYKQKEQIDAICKDNYLVLYCGGEHFCNQNKINIRTHSYNLLTIFD